MKFGWYYEEGSVQGTDDNMWDILFAAVEQANEDDRLHALFVGPMKCLAVDELLDADDVISMAREGRLTPDAICELVHERADERIYDGRAYLCDGAKPSFARVVRAHTNEVDAAEDVITWATRFIDFDFDVYCAGRRALPIEYVEGEWRHGCDDLEPREAAACITFEAETSPETGHAGWCWWALGKMGSARTLLEARERCEQIIEEALR